MVAARPDAHAGGAAVGADDRHRHRKDVGEQVGEAADVALPVLPGARHLEGDVVVGAVCLQADVAAAALLPFRQLAPHERNLFPEVPHHPRAAARGQLDDGSHDLDHPAVEVDGAAGRELERAFLAS